MENQAKAKRLGHPKEPMSAEWHRTNEEIGARLRMLRAAWALRRPRLGRGKRVTLHLPRELGVSTRSWFNWESGNNVPGPIALRLVVFTGCRPEWLLTGEGAMFRAQLVPQPMAETPVGPSIFCVS